MSLDLSGCVFPCTSPFLVPQVPQTLWFTASSTSLGSSSSSFPGCVTLGKLSHFTVPASRQLRQHRH
jgi:hypothetical protein